MNNSAWADHKFQIIFADPPWRFSSNSEKKPGRNAMRHYPCMRDEEIAALPVGEWAAQDALLFMWTTAPMLERSMAIPVAWGFRYISNEVWAKDHIGTGFWFRNQHEHLLLYKRGKFPRPGKFAPLGSSLIFAPRREHSRKPEHPQDVVDRVWPDARKLEMFARRPREGWHVWGNDTHKFPEVA